MAIEALKREPHIDDNDPPPVERGGGGGGKTSNPTKPSRKIPGSTYTFNVASSVLDANIFINGRDTRETTSKLFTFQWDPTNDSYIAHEISVKKEGYVDSEVQRLRVFQTDEPGIFITKIYDSAGRIIEELPAGHAASLNFTLERIDVSTTTTRPPPTTTTRPSADPPEQVTVLMNTNYPNDIFEVLVDGTRRVIDTYYLHDRGTTLRFAPMHLTKDELVFDKIRYKFKDDPASKITTLVFTNLPLDAAGGGELEIQRDVVVEFVYRKKATVPEPTITSLPNSLTITVENSSTEQRFSVPIGSDNALRLSVSSTRVDLRKTLDVVADFDIHANKRLPATTIMDLFFVKDFVTLGGGLGKYVLTVIPIGAGDNVGESKNIELNFVERTRKPSVTDVVADDVVVIPAYQYNNKEFEISWTTRDADKVTFEIVGKHDFGSQAANGSMSLNFSTISSKFGAQFGSNDFKITPWSGVISGPPRTFSISFTEPPKMSRDVALSAFEDVYESLLAVNTEYLRVAEDHRYLRNIMNFGEDEQSLITTWIPDDITFDFDRIEVDKAGSIILKLYEPLPPTLEINDKFWVSREITPPLVDSTIFSADGEPDCIELRPANTVLDIGGIRNTDIGFQAFDDLISSGSSTSTDLINHFLSGSIDSKELGIDYTLFENFTHFSSGVERLKNFRYKLRLIELYNLKINTIDEATASSGSSANQTERVSIVGTRDALIGGLDGYETHLYEGTGSTSWPHTGGTIYHSTASNSTEWFTAQSAVATTFDNNNRDSLKNNLPEYLIRDDENAEFVLFTHMIGHHFDILWSYIKAMRNIKKFTNNPIGNGIPDELVYNMLLSLGWDVKHGKNGMDLWEYAFGKDPNGNVLTTLSGQKYTREVWRRILNNLPYLLKHKGTRRGIQALITCYGVPASILSVWEYGGPTANLSTKGTHTFVDYSVALNLTPTSYLDIPWVNTRNSRKPDSIEFVLATPTSSNYTVLSGNSSDWSVNLIETTASLKLGKVQLSVSGSGVLNTLTSSELPIFDGGYYSVLINREAGASDTFTMFVKKSDGIQIVLESSASMVVSASEWDSGSVLRVGQSYRGKLDEFRLWNTALTESAFDNHVSFVEAQDGNHLSASTIDLEFRLSFGQAKNEGSESLTYISSSAPIQSYAAFATASGFDDETTFPYNYATFNRTVTAQVPDIGVGRLINNKVRLESQTLVSDLNPYSRATNKSFDQTSIDTNKLGVFFSPTNAVNRDIIRAFGGADLTDQIADPEAQFSSSYKELDSTNKYYWSRFPSGSSNDIWEYMRYIRSFDRSMFEHIKQMVPARSNLSTGLLIEQHMLERSRAFIHRKPTRTNHHYDGTIHYSGSQDTTATRPQYEGFVSASTDDTLIVTGSQLSYLGTVDADIVDSGSVVATFDSYTGSYDMSGSEALSASYDTYIGTAAGLATSASINVYLDTFQSQKFGFEIDGELPDHEVFGKPQTRFGIYADSGSTELLYLKDGVINRQRVKLELITETTTKTVRRLVSGSSQAGPYYDYLVSESIQRLNVIHITGSHTVGATVLDGYSYPHHYKYTSDLSTGLENSFYKGAKQTSATTIDGGPAVEIFITNPNTLRVNKAGRDVTEPILEVE